MGLTLSKDHKLCRGRKVSAPQARSSLWNLMERGRSFPGPFVPGPFDTISRPGLVILLHIH